MAPYDLCSSTMRVFSRHDAPLCSGGIGRRPLYAKCFSEHEADLGIALSRAFQPFRDSIRDQRDSPHVARKCVVLARYCLAGYCSDVLEIPWAVTEFASDTAVLTMNQIRMAFLIAAASDRQVGYRQQKSEIATVIGSAFRLARSRPPGRGQNSFWGRSAAESGHCVCGHKACGSFTRPFLSGRLWL